MILVNIGCGSVYHPGWVNLDFAPVAPEVRPCDVRERLPFGDGAADAVYHSHVLEHLDADAGRAFLRECVRILRPGGILRVAVPDFERTARAYVALLDEPGGVDPVMHEWLRLELFDQYGRARSGGAIHPFLRRLPAADHEKVRARVGLELDQFLENETRGPRSFFARFRSAGWRLLLRHARTSAARAFVRVIGGSALTAAFDEGVFRSRGEIHRAAYDRIVLRRAIASTGMRDIQVMGPGASAIPGFAGFELEVCGGRVRKPDSLFMEAVRP